MMAWSDTEPVLEIEPIPENLVREPVDFIFADHYRQRVVLDALEQFLSTGYFEKDSGAAGKQVLRRIASYLTHEFLLHVEDEDADLFPAIREHCANDASTTAVLTQLSHEHHDDPDLAGYLAESLTRLAEGRKLNDSMAFLRTAWRFVETQRRHLAWENNVVLPLARSSLTERALESVGRNIARRHGIDYPG